MTWAPVSSEDRVDHQSFDHTLERHRLVDDSLHRAFHQALDGIGLVDEILDDLQRLVGFLSATGVSLSRSRAGWLNSPAGVHSQWTTRLLHLRPLGIHVAQYSTFASQ